MKFLKPALFFVIITILVLPNISVAEQADLTPLGFKFGINKKEAKKVIDSKGKRIYKDEKDSKEMRIILMQGVIVDLPIEADGKDVMTELEFYKKKLLSTSLVFNATDEVEKDQLEAEFDQHFTEKYGEPYERDSMMYFDTTTWHIPDVMLILHTNNKANTVQVEYKYKPGLEARFEDDLDVKRGTIHKDPATQMFLEGDYSKPTDYDERFGTN